MHAACENAAPKAPDGPAFAYHPSFEDPEATTTYGRLPEGYSETLSYLPDDLTRELAKRMHYAAWRAAGPRRAPSWRRSYHQLRNRIVVGNRKLIFKAVRKWSPPSQFADDLAGECQLVLIKAVAAYNPWLGVRFSTYAFTCLMRALSRLSQRQATDRLSHSLSLEALGLGEPTAGPAEERVSPRLAQLDDLLRAADLLTGREKLVLSRRFHLDDRAPRRETLEQVGRALGLSKERVRQVQATALGKLREALGSFAP